MTRLILSLTIALAMISCEKEEIPVVYEPQGIVLGTFNSQVSMSSDYRFRLYYDLETDSVLAIHEKTEWDLAFACGAADNRIRLNDSKLMSVWRVDNVSLEEVNSVQGDGPFYDTSDGYVRALDGWLGQNAVYVIDRGYDEAGASQGRYKVELLSVNEETYFLRYAPLNNGAITEIYINKDSSINQIHFSFDEGQKTLEPPKESWDLLFTHYTFYFEEEELPYLVAGALINTNGVGAQKLNLFTFDEIDLDYVTSYTLSDQRDIIGYDWKYFNLETETYTVVENAFVVQSVEGNLFKLQFTGFVDENGERGAPAFRAAQLQ